MPKTTIITGSAGLIGSEAVRLLRRAGLRRRRHRQRHAPATSSATTASTAWQRPRSCERDRAAIPPRASATSATRRRSTASSPRYGTRHRARVIHTAAQPSHDWAAREPLTDFTINAIGTLNLLEATRQHCPEAVFIFTSHQQGLRRHAEPRCRWSSRRRAGRSAGDHPYRAHGIDESMSHRPDACTALFGASKVAADVLVQEYGRYFGMQTAVLPRRLPDRPGPLRRRAARLPRLPDEVRRHRHAVHGVRLQGQAGARQHPQRTTWSARSEHVLPGAARPARSTTSAAARFSNCSMLEAIAHRARKSPAGR